MDVVTNGRKLSQELMDGVKKNGEILLYYEYMKPGHHGRERAAPYCFSIPASVISFSHTLS